MSEFFGSEPLPFVYTAIIVNAPLSYVVRMIVQFTTQEMWKIMPGMTGYNSKEVAGGF